MYNVKHSPLLTLEHNFILSYFILWQGDLAFYHEVLPCETLASPNLETYFQEADTGPTLLPLGNCQLQAPPSSSQPDLAPLPGPSSFHLAPELEVIASPRLSSLPRHLLTSSKVQGTLSLQS